jgi:hypothetical protein
MTRSRPRLSLERSARTEILFCAPRLTVGRPPKLHSPFTHPSLALHSPFTQKPRKWLTWTNAPLVRFARGAGGARSESGNPRISGEPGRRSGPPPVECAQSGLQEGRRAASCLRRGRPWRSLRPSPLAPSLRLAVSPRRRISQTVPLFHVPVRAAGADTRVGQSNPAAAKTADEAPPRPLADASIMPRSSRSPAFGDLNATRVSRSRRWP